MAITRNLHAVYLSKIVPGLAVLTALLLILVTATTCARSAEGGREIGFVDTALIVAVDVSQSVDQVRYRLQMEGIAQSLEDPDVLNTILNAPNGGILFAMVAWADKPELVIDWQPVMSESDARRVAAMVRSLPHKGGEFTCMARMMDHVATLIVPYIPGKALRTVLDVSGDGIDNCTVPENVDQQRDALHALGVTVNGLPILKEKGPTIVGSGAYRKPGFGLRNMARGPDTATTELDTWFERHVITGSGAFLLAAKGYKDFGRAFRQKFVIEISASRHRDQGITSGLRWLQPMRADAAKGSWSIGTASAK